MELDMPTAMNVKMRTSGMRHRVVLCICTTRSDDDFAKLFQDISVRSIIAYPKLMTHY
jgi:hypothetical protein